MKKKGMMIVLGIVVLFFARCAKNVNNPEDDNGSTFNPLVQAYGTDTTFELATWNLENFPIYNGDIEGAPDPEREEYFRQLFLSLKIDLMGVEEINYPQNLEKIFRSYDSLQVIISPENVSQRVGVIFNRQLFEIAPGRTDTLLFEDENDYFPRAPLMVPLREIGSDFVFQFIVVHLKASSDETSRLRRQQSIEMLYEYARNEVMNKNEHLILVGDFNSDADNESFLRETFMKDSLFAVLTVDSLYSRKSYYASYPFLSSLIDHIVISRNVLSRIHLLDVETLRLDDSLKDYLSKVSDHRPVAIKWKMK